MKKDLRDSVIAIRVTPEEREIIEINAINNLLSTSAYLRIKGIKNN